MPPHRKVRLQAARCAGAAQMQRCPTFRARCVYAAYVAHLAGSTPAMLGGGGSMHDMTKRFRCNNLARYGLQAWSYDVSRQPLPSRPASEVTGQNQWTVVCAPGEAEGFRVWCRVAKARWWWCAPLRLLWHLQLVCPFPERRRQSAHGSPHGIYTQEELHWWSGRDSGTGRRRRWGGPQVPAAPRKCWKVGAGTGLHPWAAGHKGSNVMCCCTGPKTT